MLAAMRSPMRRSAAADNSELSPSEGNELLETLGWLVAGCASENCAQVKDSVTASANRRQTGRNAAGRFLEWIKGNKSNNLCSLSVQQGSPEKTAAAGHGKITHGPGGVIFRRSRL